LEIASSRQTSATDRPAAPTRSNRPPVRTLDSGTSVATSTVTTAPSAAAVQNSTCQSVFSTRSADAGRPSAPPTPSDALINAVAEPSRSAGSSSRMMLMPNGITPAAAPCSTRPMIIGSRLDDRAATNEPATSRTRLNSSIRRLPYMSPRRPTTGVATALASSVAVITQVVSAGSAWRSSGSWGTSGITRVCMSETTMPPRASTTTTTFGRGGAALVWDT
jgi:hypothetical protein